MRLNRFFAVCSLLFLSASPAMSAVQSRSVEYQHDGKTFQGYFAYDDALEGKRPGVLVVHEWKGLGDYAKKRADQLAALGYAAFAADMYGKGVFAKDHEEAGKLAGALKDDRGLMRARSKAALDTLAAQPETDASKLAAIGYCFGGTTVLEMARAGAPVKGVASFHGALSTPNPAKPGEIRSKILVQHGAADQFVPQEEVAAFKKEMADAGADLRFKEYEGAVHSFTVPEAGNDPSKGMAYNEEADKQSWQELQDFFKEIFA